MASSHLRRICGTGRAVSGREPPGAPCEDGELTWSITVQVMPSAAASLQALLLEAAQRQSQAASSQEMIVMLLQVGRPWHFSSFEAFAAWRHSSAAAVCQSLSLGAAGLRPLAR